MPSVWTFVSDRISSTLTINDLALRKFWIRLNNLPSITALCMSIRMPYLHVKSYAFSISTCPLFAWAFLTVASRDKRWSTVVRLALPPHYSVDSVLIWSKKSNSLTFTLLTIKVHRTLVKAIGRILAAKFCCIEQEESLILLEGGVSTFHCGSCPGQEQSFWWLGSFGKNYSFEKGLL